MLEPFFWDVKFSGIRLDKHKDFIIERLLEEGNSEAIRWLLKNVSTKDIERVVCHSRRLSRKTVCFWQNRLGIETAKICTKKRSTRPLKMLWPY